MAKIAAFFDIDGTLIRGASTWYLARDLYSRGYFGLRSFALAAWQSFLYQLLGESPERIESVKNHALNVVKGNLESDLALVGEELYDHFLQERLFPGMLKIIQRHLDSGHEVWLISATPQQISEQMAYRLGLTGSIGTVIEVDDSGRFTGNMPKSLMHGETKATATTELAAQRGLDLKYCYAYSDSISDRPLLNLVGNPVAVNPDWKLRRLAKRSNWPIYDFAHRRPDIAINARTRLLPGVFMGLGWTVQVLWRYVIRRLLALPLAPVKLARKLWRR